MMARDRGKRTRGATLLIGRKAGRGSGKRENGRQEELMRQTCGETTSRDSQRKDVSEKIRNGMKEICSVPLVI